MKTCSKCKEEKPLLDFYKDRKYLRSKCKICDNETRKICYKKKPTSREQSREAELKYLYNITPQQYLQMFVDQEGCCAICSTPQNELKKRLSVDHCHSTLKNRGLLCQKCNVLLGMAGDNSDILLAALSYLEKRK
jgi:hypothetical protein